MRLAYTSVQLLFNIPKVRPNSQTRGIWCMKLANWDAALPYLLVDHHFENVTPPEIVPMDKEYTRDTIWKGYLQRCDFEKGVKVIGA